MSQPPTELHTTAGDVALHEYRLTVGERVWKVLHTGAVLTEDDEQLLLNEREARLPYGVSLWPAAIALAHEIVARAAELRGRRILELGAGTGLPGIVAESLGAHVVQTDRHEAVLDLLRLNGERNAVPAIEYRVTDWRSWDDPTRYDWIIGADILYADAMHEPLRHIFDSSLVAGGRILLADPFRRSSFRMLDSLEEVGWTVRVSTWNVGEPGEQRRVGVFELSREDYAR